MRGDLKVKRLLKDADLLPVYPVSSDESEPESDGLESWSNTGNQPSEQSSFVILAKVIDKGGREMERTEKGAVIVNEIVIYAPIEQEPAGELIQVELKQDWIVVFNGFRHTIRNIHPKPTHKPKILKILADYES